MSMIVALNVVKKVIGHINAQTKNKVMINVLSVGVMVTGQMNVTAKDLLIIQKENIIIDHQLMKIIDSLCSYEPLIKEIYLSCKSSIESIL